MQRMVQWLGCVAFAAPPAPAQPQVTVTLFDIADLGPKVRDEMKRETSRIFLEAGVELEWVDCEVAGSPMNLAECARPLGPSRLMLQLVPGANKANPRSSGLAILQEGSSVLACLYPQRVKELARDASWDFGDLLGHAAAHELGHRCCARPRIPVRVSCARVGRRRTCGCSRMLDWSFSPDSSRPFRPQRPSNWGRRGPVPGRAEAA